MSIREDEIRLSRVTSSECYRVLSKKTCETYVEQIRNQKKLKRSLQKEANAKPLLWGKLCESYLKSKHEFNITYPNVKEVTLKHSDLDNWCGTPDSITEDSVADIKAPWTLQSFIDLEKIVKKKDIEYFKTVNPKYYWQLVSNSIICNKKFAELIVYCPYYDELSDIILHINDNLDLMACRTFTFMEFDELPFIYKDSDFKDLNIFKFEVPNSDKELLTETIKQITI